jgi:predicted PurR-regulated permease PerM
MSNKSKAPERIDFDRVVRWIISIGTIVAVVWLLRYLAEVLIPFVVALLIAYLLNPVVNVIDRRVQKREISVLATVVGCMLIAAIAVGILVPLVGAQISDFQGVLSELREGAHADGGEAQSLGERFDGLINDQSNENVRWVLVKVREFVTSDEFRVDQIALGLWQNVAPGVWGVVTGALRFLLGLSVLVVVILYVVFLLNDFELVQRSWKEQLPPAYRDSLVKFIDEFHLAMSRYFRGQFLIASCMAILFAIGFSLIGLRLAIVLGVFVGMLNMVPYLQTIGIIPAAILAILRAVEAHSSIWMSLALVLVVFGVAQTIQDVLLTPRIMGKATGLRPAIILLCVFIWGKLLGFLGVVLAIPLTCLGLAYYRRFVLKWRHVEVMAGEDSH